MQNLTSRIPIQNLVPIALSALGGVIASPAFTFGAFVKSKASATVALLLFAGWSFVQWRMFWADYGVYPEAGATFAALYNRTFDEAKNAALVGILGVNIAWLVAGIMARQLYDRYLDAIVPVSMAVSALALVIGVQTYSHRADAAYRSASAIEVGKQQAMTVTRKISDDVVKDVAMTDREKLVVHYAQLSAARSVYGVAPPFSFGEYLEWVAAACAGQEKDAPLCDNRLLQQVKAQQVSAGL